MPSKPTDTRLRAIRGKALARWAANRTRKTSPSPLLPHWEPGPAQYGIGVRHNVAVPMMDGVVLRADVHYPTDPASGAPASGPFPVLLSITPYGKKAPPPAAQIGGGATPYLIRRGYIEVMADVRGTGVSGGAFVMLGPEQVQDGVDLVNWAAALPNSNGRVGMLGISYLAINQLFTAAAVGPDSPLKAIFPAMAANDFYRDVATMGGVAHMHAIRAYGATFSLLNVLNPSLEFARRGAHERPRAGGISAVRQRGRDQRGYFGPLTSDASAGGDTAFDGPFWASMRPCDVLPKIVENGVAVFLVGGWHDAFQRGAPLNYAILQNAFAGRAADAPMTPEQLTSDRFQFMAGPWYHVSNLDGLHLQALQLRWFDRWLKDDDSAALSGSPVRFRAIGSSQWFRTDAYPFPEAEPTRLYLNLGGGLDDQPSPNESDAQLRYAARGPVSGRSFEQWSLGLGSFAVSQTGRRIRYDLDHRRLHREALTYSTAILRTAQLVAGPITLTVYATATTTDTLWVAYLDDVAPDGISRPLTQGALLGSHRALDTAKTWYLPDGAVLQPHHMYTRAAAQPVVPGELTRYDIEIFPTAALIEAGHRLRLALTTYDFPSLVPSKSQRAALAGGVYHLRQGGVHASSLLIPLADPEAMRHD
jgi:putative CocE/NonD family hydrolase